MNRPSIHATLMATARVWSRRSTCSRANVGAVLAVGGQVIAAGYNGAPAGLEHCDHPKINGCFLAGRHSDTDSEGRLHCTNAVHAEVNAILNAAKRGCRTRGAALYVTHYPCARCAGLLINAGVSSVIYLKSYGDTTKAAEMFEAAHIEVRSLRQAERDDPQGHGTW